MIAANSQASKGDAMQFHSSSPSFYERAASASISSALVTTTMVGTNASSASISSAKDGTELRSAAVNDSSLQHHETEPTIVKLKSLKSGIPVVFDMTGIFQQLGAEKEGKKGGENGENEHRQREKGAGDEEEADSTANELASSNGPPPYFHSKWLRIIGKVITDVDEDKKTLRGSTLALELNRAHQFENTNACGDQNTQNEADDEEKEMKSSCEHIAVDICEVFEREKKAMSSSDAESFSQQFLGKYVAVIAEVGWTYSDGIRVAPQNSSISIQSTRAHSILVIASTDLGFSDYMQRRREVEALKEQWLLPLNKKRREGDDRGGAMQELGSIQPNLFTTPHQRSTFYLFPPAPLPPRIDVIHSPTAVLDEATKEKIRNGAERHKRYLEERYYFIHLLSDRGDGGRKGKVGEEGRGERQTKSAAVVGSKRNERNEIDLLGWLADNSEKNGDEKTRSREDDDVGGGNQQSLYRRDEGEFRPMPRLQEIDEEDPQWSEILRCHLGGVGDDHVNRHDYAITNDLSQKDFTQSSPNDEGAEGKAAAVNLLTHSLPPPSSATAKSEGDSSSTMAKNDSQKQLKRKMFLS